MDKTFIKELKLEEVLKRFNQLNEYTFITSPMLSEDGEDDSQQPMDNQQQQVPPTPNDQNGGQQPTNASQGGDMNQINQNQNGVQSMPPMDNNQEGAPMGDEQGLPMTDTSPTTEPMGDEGSEEVDVQQEGDEVIDIDDLTKAQETSEIKIDGVDDKLTRMLSILTKFSTALEANNRKIEILKKEFEERNPSEQEKLNIRSQASYPYAETPKDYWDKKTASNPHYNVIHDNNVSTADELKKFEITKDDVDNINFNDISKSFDLEDYLKF